eukprot:scaffold33989_cov96-Isochrysis_galbana.AAC.1
MVAERRMPRGARAAAAQRVHAAVIQIIVGWHQRGRQCAGGGAAAREHGWCGLQRRGVPTAAAG